MSNMSYCRFRNTLLALEDCLDAMQEDLYAEDGEKPEKLSKEEEGAKKRLIELCADITREFHEDD